MHKPYEFVAVRIGPCALCLGIGNQVLEFEQFALFPKDGISHFAEPYLQEFSGGQLATEISNVGLVMSMQVCIASCMMPVVRDLVLYQ